MPRDQVHNSTETLDSLSSQLKAVLDASQLRPDMRACAAIVAAAHAARQAAIAPFHAAAFLFDCARRQYPD